MKIPDSSISRISLYYRALLSLKNVSIVSSQELSDFTGCSAAQIRKDLAYFGQFGRPGLGYEVPVLKSELKKVLGIDKKWNVAIIGAGNLGSALLAYKGFKKQGFNIICAFDNHPAKIEKSKQDIKIYDIAELKSKAFLLNIEMAIIAVPHETAQVVTEKIIDSGIKAILNFAPIRLKVPNGIEVLNLDLSAELERLSYFLKRTEE